MKERRNTSALPPLTPEGCGTDFERSKPDNQTLASWWKRLLALERRRHGQVESILTRQITQLEQQVSDLRGLYLRTITMPIAPNPNPKGKK
jgi:hypothetical protein